MAGTLTLKEIASRIDSFLKEFEADPMVNIKRNGWPPYYLARAFSNGRYVGVVYISFQGTHHLSKKDALAYLEWLEAGHVGEHFQALEDYKKIRKHMLAIGFREDRKKQ